MGGSGFAETVEKIQLANQTPAPAGDTLGARLAPFLGRPYSHELAAEVTDQILRHYQEQDHPVVMLSLEPDAFRNGILTVQVQEGTIGQISQRGGRHLAQANPLLSNGEILTGTKIQRELDWLNRNPFHRATFTATPGETPDVADIEFVLSDSLPFAVWLSYSNDGVAPLGESRHLVGVSFGDFLKWDQTLTAQIQTADDIDLYCAGMAEWKIRTPSHHELAFNGAVVTTETPAADGLTVEGNAWLASGSYIIPWRSSLALDGESWLKAEVKHFDTDVFFGGESQVSEPLDVATFSLGTKMKWAGKSNAWDLSGEAVYSPGNLWGHSSDADYAASSRGAESNFCYIRGTATWTHTWGNRWSIVSLIGGQWADGPLLTSEAFHLTGANAVRGYRDRSILGASSLRGSVEVRSSYSQIPLSNHGQWQVVGFADAGKTWTEQVGTDSPIALGTGLRLQFGTWGQVRCDAACPLTDGLPPRVHLHLRVFF